MKTDEKRKKEPKILLILILLLTIAVFSQVRTHDFINYDDDIYITHNIHSKKGLSSNGLLWAFTASPSGNWHPLTWLSHMLDTELFGLDPGPHHLINLSFHVANTLLLFLVLNRMTKAFYRSLFAAALFALHPLHAESVAWAAERKDVLSAFFWLLAMYTYAIYAENPAAKRYALVVLFFILGLLSKPMLVTLPFVLILLDYWPLGRLRPAGRLSKDARAGKTASSFSALIIEKAPLFALALSSSMITFFAERGGKSIGSLEVFSLKTRVFNAFCSYLGYLGKAVWPENLAVFYPYPETIPLFKFLLSVILLAAITSLVLWQMRRHSYLFTGWLWYLGTLVPVIGFIQVGSQAMADRYTYIPLIGIFIMVSWGIPLVFQKLRYRKIILSIAGGTVLLILSFLTWIQLGYWQNSIALFTHAIQVTSHSNIAHNNLGSALAEQGKFEEAVIHFNEALRGKHDHTNVHYNLGVAFAKLGDFEKSLFHLQKAFKKNTELSDACYKIGAELLKNHRPAQAVRFLREALRVQPLFPEAHYKLGMIMTRSGHLDEAVFHFKKALEIKPDFAAAHNNLGTAFAGLGKLEEAAFHFKEAIRINPEFTEAKKNLRRVMLLRERND